jgi:hypothetical protein
MYHRICHQPHWLLYSIDVVKIFDITSVSLGLIYIVACRSFVCMAAFIRAVQGQTCLFPAIDRKTICAHTTQSINSATSAATCRRQVLLLHHQHWPSPVCMPLYSVVDAASEQLDNRSTLATVSSRLANRDTDADQRIRDVGSLTPLPNMYEQPFDFRFLRTGYRYQNPPHVSACLASESEARQVDTRVSLWLVFNVKSGIRVFSEHISVQVHGHILMKE